MGKLFIRMTLGAVLALSGASAPIHSTAADPSTTSLQPLRAESTRDKTIVHVLNRLGFGPRPGDVDRVRDLGLERFIEQQLHPERIADSAVDARLKPLTSIGMSRLEIVRAFEVPQAEARRERQLAAQKGQDAQPPAPNPEMQRRNNQLILDLSQQKLLRAIYSERQLQEVLTDFWFNHFNVDARKGRDRFLLTEYERDAIRPHVLGKFRDLLEATAKSPAMLFYLDNWQSVDPNGPHLGRQVGLRPRFRPGGFGNGGLVVPPVAGQNQPVNRQRRGLNENYGRELMELHTLGVDGGYTQQDVTEVARAFTGWTIDNPRQGGGYRFDPRLHDPGDKVVLGHRIRGNGEADGEQVLDMLAAHPATAHFIATKLVRRFVSDTPPPALVDRAAARFHDTGGDIREVVRTIITSPEFFAPDAYRTKVKTPFEFVVSVVRATGAEVDEALPLVRALQQLGMPLYQCQPPTGYKDTADAWVNTGALVNRMNLALAISSGRMRGITLDSRRPGAPTPEPADRTSEGGASLDSQAVIETVLNGDVSESTRATIAKATTIPQTLALTLGSPEFQRK